MGIRFRITLVMLAMINLAVILSGFIIYLGTGTVLRNVTERNVKDLLDSEKKSVELLLNQEILLPAYLTREDDILALLRGSRTDADVRAATASLDRYYRTRTDLEGVFLVDRKGDIIADVNRSMVGTSLADRAYHRETVEGKKPVIGETVTSRNTGRQIFVVTNPVLSPDTGEMLGYVCVAVPSAHMAGSLATIKLNHADSSFACLVDENGNYIYHPLHAKIGQPVEIPEIRDASARIQRHETVETDLLLDASGRDGRVTAFSVIEGADWILFTVGGMDATMAELRALSFQVVVLDIFFLLAASALSFFIAKRISLPVITALKQNNEELNALYNEIAASEEELQDQLEQIQQSSARLEVSESKYRTLLDNSEDIIYSCECDKTLTAANAPFRRYYGLIDPPIGTCVTTLLSDDAMRTKWEEAFEETLHDRTRHEIEYSECMNGTTRFFSELLSPIEDKNHAVLGITATKRDMTDRIEHEMKIMELAYHDHLTHLPNRILFFDELQKAVSQCGTTPSLLAVALLDVDNFKKINDTLGHSAGDELLVFIAERLRGFVDPHDVLSRLGGDEYALLLNACPDQKGIAAFMETLCNRFRDTILLHGASISISFSIGIAVYPLNGGSAEELMKHADTAMNKAKEHGRNNFLFFDDCMNQELVRKTDLERKLKGAIERGELSLHYQPQYRLADRSLIGFEALLRWDNEDLGSIRPSEFIPIAEETGLILPIGEWIIQQACATSRKMMDAGGTSLLMAVNLSPVQFKSPKLLRFIEETAKHAGIRLENMELEITEGVFIEDQEQALHIMTQMQDLGIRIALDDFGTGYSSLSYLRNLPISRLKIDKSFISDIAVRHQKELIETIIHLSHKLGIECLAEGVETAEQQAWLSEVACDSVQGFHFSKPIPERAALAMLEKR